MPTRLCSTPTSVVEISMVRPLDQQTNGTLTELRAENVELKNQLLELAKKAPAAE